MARGRPRSVIPHFELKPTPHGVWEIRWTEGGRTRTRSTGERERTGAEKALRRHVAEFHLPKRPQDPLLDGLIDEYVSRHVPKLASPDSQRQALAKIKENLGAYRPDEITETALADYAQWRRSQTRWGRSGTIGDGTIAWEVNALRAVLGWAARNRLIGARPEIRLPVAHPEGRQRFLSADEVRRLLDAAKTVPHLALFIRIALATGARRSAILQLTWDRVIWPEQTDPLVWRFGPEREYEYLGLAPGLMLDMGRGVGNKKRSITPIGDNAPLYKSLRAAQKIAKTNYVIEWRGSRVADIKTAFNAACSKAGIEEFTVHGLKHTSVSWMVRSGMSFPIIAKVTGTSQATLETHYAHLSPDLAKELGDLFSV